MVVPLDPPARPISGGTSTTIDATEGPLRRIYHMDQRSPSGIFRRSYGPTERFDHHTPKPLPAEDPDGRAVIYLAREIGVCGAEVFGDVKEANICPQYRAVAALPNHPTEIQDLVGAGVMALGALAGLGTGDVSRRLSQEWARAVYEDDPAGHPVDGVRYLGAHDGQEAIALWERAPALDVIQHPGGMVADAALSHPPLWRRFTVEMRSRGIVVRRIQSSQCVRCQTVPSI